MFNLLFPLILCSKSPRRAKILSDLGFNFDILNIDTEESFPTNLSKEVIPRYISDRKWIAARAIILNPHSIILTADTMVFLDEKPLGKPKDRDEAIHFLNLLSNRTHFVITGFSLGLSEQDLPKTSKSIISKVTFKPLCSSLINDYVESGSPFDKAGGYGYQDDVGSSFVSSIEGLESNVIGLPIEAVVSEMKALNFFTEKI